jgi:hypothetical protein
VAGACARCNEYAVPHACYAFAYKHAHARYDKHPYEHKHAHEYSHTPRFADTQTDRDSRSHRDRDPCPTSLGASPAADPALERSR